MLDYISKTIYKYSGLKELKSEDLKLINNYNTYQVKTPKRKIIYRANVIFEVFHRQTKHGMYINDFIEKLKTYEWLNKNDFDLVYELGGEIPLIVTGTESVIRISNYPPNSIALYFKLSEEVGYDELFFYLKSRQPIENRVQMKNLKVSEVILFIDIENVKKCKSTKKLFFCT